MFLNYEDVLHRCKSWSLLVGVGRISSARRLLFHMSSLTFHGFRWSLGLWCNSAVLVTLAMPATNLIVLSCDIVVGFSDVHLHLLNGPHHSFFSAAIAPTKWEYWECDGMGQACLEACH